MNYLIVIIVIGGLIYLITKWIDMKKAIGQSDGYARRRAVFWLFSAFIALIGISSIFAEAIFGYFGVKKPQYMEWILCIAYVAFCLATVWIFRNNKSGDKNNIAVQVNNGNGNVQNNTFN